MNLRNAIAMIVALIQLDASTFCTNIVRSYDDLYYNTLKITATFPDQISEGTGFLFDGQHEGQKDLYLVTSKHVLINSENAQKAENISINFHSRGSSMFGAFEQRPAKIKDPFVYMHPDQAVDLCMIPLNSLIETIEKRYSISIYYRALGLNHILTDFSTQPCFQEVLIAGYPVGIFDHINNIPLVHKGITATPSSMPYKGRQEFLIQAPCYAGSAGSPVFVFPGHNAAATTGTHLSAICLLGVLWGGPQYTEKGNIECDQDHNIISRGLPTSYTRNSWPVNHGFVMRGSRIIELWRQTNNPPSPVSGTPPAVK